MTLLVIFCYISLRVIFFVLDSNNLLPKLSTLATEVGAKRDRSSFVGTAQYVSPEVILFIKIFNIL